MMYVTKTGGFLFAATQTFGFVVKKKEKYYFPFTRFENISFLHTMWYTFVIGHYIYLLLDLLQ